MIRIPITNIRFPTVQGICAISNNVFSSDLMLRQGLIATWVGRQGGDVILFEREGWDPVVVPFNCIMSCDIPLMARDRLLGREVNQGPGETTSPVLDGLTPDEERKIRELHGLSKQTSKSKKPNRVKE